MIGRRKRLCMGIRVRRIMMQVLNPPYHASCGIAELRGYDTGTDKIESERFIERMFSLILHYIS